MPLSAGVHEVTLRAEEHEDLVLTVEIRGEREERLEEVALKPWGILDLSRLRQGVVALRDGKRLQNRTRIPPEPVEIIQKRRGYAPQKRRVTVPAGKGIRIKALPWDRYLAKLDVSGLPEDVKAYVDGQLVRETAAFEKKQVVEVELRRPGFAPQVQQVKVRVGRTSALTPSAWERLPGRINPRSLPKDVVAELDGKPIVAPVELAPGKYTVQLMRPGYSAQKVRVEIHSEKDARVKIGRWKRSILRDLDGWDAATTDERREAAERVEKKTPGFALSGLQTFQVGGERHEVAIFLEDFTGMEFVLIPSGSFVMGSPHDEEGRNTDERLHEVVLSSPFLISRNEVSQAVWEHVMETNPAVFAQPQHPVERVSWFECQQFCEKTELALPTEAQWEYACRAGTTSAYFFGDDPDAADEYAWHSGNSNRSTQPVGTKNPNAFGLFDMLGNVWEWCEDEYEEYPDDSATDPVGSSGSGVRVLRGGSWNFTALFARSAFRRKNAPANRFISLGFRVARPLRNV
jgi:formylglycine-generating enzyme required for sulfatase activity